MQDCSELLKERTEYANNVIDKFLPESEGFLEELLSAMAYSVKAGGKRLRPVLIDSVYRVFGGQDKLSEPFMAAMEYLHTYSLVHDDMPEIDNDDYRRGQLTTHKKYGGACGLLAGDGLLHWSTQVALKAFDMTDKSENVIRAMQIFAEKSGPYGMLGGQSVDVLYTGKNPDKERLDFIYRLKTCALIEGSMMIGAALAGASDEDIAECESIGRYVGLAFQIKDDILDYVSTAEELGKPVGSDEKNDKTTYVTLFGIDEAQKEVERLSVLAMEALNKLKLINEEEKAFLSWLVYSLVGRTH